MALLILLKWGARVIFDHLVVGGTTLLAAQAHVEEALGVPMQTGGAHEVFQTHNMLMGLEDGLYLEAIAPNPDVAPPTRPRWYDLDRFTGPPRLSNWACAVDDMEAALTNMPPDTGQPVEVRRGDLQWRMAVSRDGTTPFDNLWPALIEWPRTAVHPSSRLSCTNVRLRRFTLVHPDGLALATTLRQFLADDRIAIETGAYALHAEFETPHGIRTL
ncbi:MAG: VOC family protein [Tateyamaria sp.]